MTVISHSLLKLWQLNTQGSKLATVMDAIILDQDFDRQFNDQITGLTESLTEVPCVLIDGLSMALLVSTLIANGVRSPIADHSCLFPHCNSFETAHPNEGETRKVGRQIRKR